LTSKTRQWIPIERRLTANEVEQLPVIANLAIDSSQFDVFIIVRKRG
jgi:hypothetical protein